MNTAVALAITVRFINNECNRFLQPKILLYFGTILFAPPPHPSMPLPSCPQCDCLACVLSQHPQQHSLLRIQGLASWCKVNHAGGREDGARVQAKERPCASCNPFGHVVETVTWLREEEVCLHDQDIAISSWSCDTGSICLNSTNGF